MIDKSKKAIFREGLNDFYKEFYNVENVSSLSGKQKSEGLGIFYFRDIYFKINPPGYEVDIEFLKESITDGKDDQGVDMIISNNHHRIIVQLKYAGKSRIANESEVISFLEIPGRLHYKLGNNYKKNERVLDAVEDIDWENDKFSFLYITLGRASNDIDNLCEKGMTDFDHKDLNNLSERSDFLFLDENALNSEYRDVLTSRPLENITIRLSEDTEKNKWYKHEIGEKKSYLSTIKVGQIFELSKKYRSKLFDLNIRDHIGSTATNKSISDTAVKDPENFFFYNNGMSAVASEIKEDERSGDLICNDFSIINGAQTFRSLAKAYRDQKNTNSLRDLKVMIRITEIPDIDDRSDVITKITQYNNTQNPIKISDFRSNDSIQYQLKTEFEKIKDQGKSYYYKNKRTSDTKNNTKAINLDDFCKTIYSFKRGPIDFFGGMTHLYDTGVKGGYNYLFKDQDTGKILETLSSNQFKIFSSIFFLSEDLKTELMKERKSRENSDKIVKRALAGNYMIVYMGGCFLKNLAKRADSSVDEFLLKNNFYNPSVIRQDKKYQTLIKDIVESSCDLLVHDYRTKSKDANFIHRNWFRNKDTLKDLYEAINDGERNCRKIYESFIGG